MFQDPNFFQKLGRPIILVQSDFVTCHDAVDILRLSFIKLVLTFFGICTERNQTCYLSVLKDMIRFLQQIFRNKKYIIIFNTNYILDKNHQVDF